MFSQQMTKNVRFTVSVIGDTTHTIYNKCGARQIELVTLYTIFVVVTNEHVGLGKYLIHVQDFRNLCNVLKSNKEKKRK